MTPNQIYVLVEPAGDRLEGAALECVALGHQLAEKLGAGLFALVLGRRRAGLASALSTSYQLGGIIQVDDPQLDEYSMEAYCEALAEVLKADQPRMLLMAHSYQNIDLAPRLAARVRSALVTDCVGFKIESDELVFTRQVLRDKFHCDVRISSRYPWLLTVREGVLSGAQVKAGTAPIELRSVGLSGVSKRRVLDRVAISRGKVDLSKADVILGVGRGIKKAENLPLVEELASVIGAELGASRPVVDSGWLERERQIGSSGQTVSPRLYVALGISGAIQHVVGIRSSGCIVAINSDRHAPIFSLATYGIVGDVLEILPVLTRQLKGV